MTCTEPKAIAAVRRLFAWLAVGGLLLAVPGRAAAGDFDMLRGSLTNPFTSNSYRRWDGVNFGAQLGASNLNTDFGNSTTNEIAYILRNTEVENQFSPSNWTTLPATSTTGRQYGFFLGYNWQSEQIVAGFDLAYNRIGTLSTSASDVIARQVVTSPDNVNNALTITTQASLQMVDYATARARIGYAMGQFLPYVTVGGAVGRFNYASTATVHNVGTPPVGSPILPFDTTETQSESKDKAIVGGVTFGLGLDVSILPNVFLRAEWEYVGFGRVAGIRTNLNTGRVGIGVKF